jgi:hypothetical protein
MVRGRVGPAVGSALGAELGLALAADGSVALVALDAGLVVGPAVGAEVVGDAEGRGTDGEGSEEGAVAERVTQPASRAVDAVARKARRPMDARRRMHGDTAPNGTPHPADPPPTSVRPLSPERTSLGRALHSDA